MKNIRTSRISKVIACYLAMQLIIMTIQPAQLFALTSGPSQPEFNSFTPIGTSDMVDLSSGDFNYNIPIMDVGGYPLNLAYNSGITMDQEASWVGLGWNLNVGQINRQLRGLPDDFNGDEITYENNLRTNFTAGMNVGVKAPVFGFDFLNLGIGLGMQYNNYSGISFNSNYGASFNISENVSAGLNISNSNGEGVTVTPSVGLSHKNKDIVGQTVSAFSSNIGVPFNSRQGIVGLNLSASASGKYDEYNKNTKQTEEKDYSGGASSSLSFNDNLSYNPTNELSFINANLTLNFGLDLEIYGSEAPHIDITGFGSLQMLRDDDRLKNIKGFGYAYTENASPTNSMLDFNRENDRTVTKNTTMLPIANQTYDLYAINGQGIGGMFRPHRSQVGHVYDQTVAYYGAGGSTGFEIGPGTAVHFGGNVKVNPSFTRSGRWQDSSNPLLGKFVINNSAADQNIDYEPVYYKTVGELNADLDFNYSSSIINETAPIKMGIGGGEFNRRTEPFYSVKKYGDDLSVFYDDAPASIIKRKERQTRTQSIQMIKFGGVKKNEDGQIRINTLPTRVNGEEFTVPDSHDVGVKILKPDGSTYVFGETAYNTNKIESTFALNGTGNCKTGLVNYSNNDDSRSNNNGRDHFFNKIHTPAYVHTYLLSSVLSSDYEDLTNDGPTDDDLGAYTRFTYSEPQQYNWRVPFGKSQAIYSEGLYADDRDNKGNYVYGEKELKYINKIETKTHIAIFDLSDRRDAFGVGSEYGGISLASPMMKINTIRLYSKPEYIENQALLEDANPNNDPIDPIKTAHFEYNYKLCKNLPNNRDFTSAIDDIEDGKLTLEKVYFTYRGSNMGQYTPYQFNYDGMNPDYHIKEYDVWGNYKPMPEDAGCGNYNNTTTAEFPFVQQDNRTMQDQYASSWTMTSIDLPSGGQLQLEYETDDYGHVQNKHTMQMFKVVGAGDRLNSVQGQRLYDGSDDYDYLYVQIPEGTTAEEFKDDYLKDIGTSDANPMYFRFFLNMKGSKYDYVTGYALINKEASVVFTENGNTYGAIKLRRVEKEGGIINSNQMVNPIAKAGWYFGRKNLNRLVYGLPAPEIDEPGDLLALGQAFVSAIADITPIFTGPNEELRRRNCARDFSPKKSWIRLYHPDETKFGGGIRVKKLELLDNWNAMTNNSNEELYSNFYGQEYAYANTDGSSSGVATFEPNGSKENPLIQPFYDNPQKLQAPKEYNYVEKPIGQSLYPSPSVTYGRVVVSNLKREKKEDSDSGSDPVITTLKKHATGRVISEFYTTKDFPTIADFTDITPRVDVTGILGSVLNVRTRKNLTYSQGFVVRTNDMNGKQRSQKVQTEGQSGNEFISKVDYKYNVKSDGSLNNNVTIIKPDGNIIDDALLGVTHDMVHDFRSYENSSTVMGVDGNLAALLVFIGILPVPTLLPVVQKHTQDLRTVATTKVIHSTGILKEKIAYDLGSSVSTKNLAWDAQTGSVLLTKTINEYDENYYNLNYPANWHYANTGAASNNLDVSGILVKGGNDYPLYTISSFVQPLNSISSNSILTLGDELIIERSITEGLTITDRVWVAGFENSGSTTYLINRNGEPFVLEDDLIGQATFRVYRSGYRNLQAANMASVTLQKNPIISNQITNQSDWANLNVINASAVEYSDAWNSQCEFRLPNPSGLEFDANGNVINLQSLGFNPYLYNVKGDWRALKSHAYLTGRNNGEQGYNPRKEGFFDTFKPFYKISSGSWIIENPDNTGNRWTFASQVTKYSPYGAELENMDALERYSAAQYGYRYTLPTAVGSNAQYRELAFDSFEDYDFNPINTDITTPINPHFGFQDEVNANNAAVITSLESHSGRNSIKLSASSSAKITHRLIDCEAGTSSDFVVSADAANSGCYPGSVIINVLANDNFNYNTLSGIQIVTPPNLGTAIVDDSGTSDLADDNIIYTNPSGGLNTGEVVLFTYRICETTGGCSNATTVTVTSTCDPQKTSNSNTGN